jgi:uncharacterized protein (TIGR02266 family)
LRVAYEHASSGVIEAEVLDVGTGGVFILTPAPVSPGKRLSLEFFLAGETTRWSALARVLWVRPSGSPDGPPGMGVKFIDADDAVITLIERLADSREQTDPGTGGVMPPRERTMLGMGLVEEKAPAAMPIVNLGPQRNKTMLGIQAPRPQDIPEAPRDFVETPASGGEPLPQEVPAPLPEPLAAPPPPEPTEDEEGEALELVTKKPDRTESKPPVAAKEPESSEPVSEELLAAAGVPHRRGKRRTWLVVLLVLAMMGGGVYLFRHRIPWERLRYFVATLRSARH